MRKMRNIDTGSVIEISEHLITRNFWEYYISTEDTDDPLVKFGYVMGWESEFGYIYMPELSPYIITRTSDLNGIAPAVGFEWID